MNCGSSKRAVGLIAALCFMGVACGAEIDETLARVEGVVARVETSGERMDGDSAQELGLLTAKITTLAKADPHAKAFLIKEIRRYAGAEDPTAMEGRSFAAVRRSYGAFSILFQALEAADEHAFVDLSMAMLEDSSIVQLFKEQAFQTLFVGHRIRLKFTKPSQLPDYDGQIKPLALKFLKDMKADGKVLSEAQSRQLLESFVGYDAFSLPPIDRKAGIGYMREVVDGGRPFEEKVWYYRQLARYAPSDRNTMIQLLRDYVGHPDRPVHFRAKYARVLHGIGAMDQETVLDLERQAKLEREERTKRYQNGKATKAEAD